MRKEIRAKYAVKEVKKETPNVSTLKLTLDNGEIPQYHSGQFINIYFPETNTPEGKSYSMSSSPDDKTINITVKAIGEFSNRLCSLKAGDSINASLPYGYFWSESEDSTLIMIAAGIGIAPMRSMIADSIKMHPERKLALFYTNRRSEDIIFKEEFDRLEDAHPKFKVIYFVTREQSNLPMMISRRMAVADIVGANGKENIAGREFLVCGSISFVGDMWKGLRSAGVSEEHIYTEAFFSH